MITGLYAGLLTLLYAFLSFKVIRLREKLKVLIGDGDKPELFLAIRVHANFTEYVPLGLILLLFVEMNIHNTTLSHILGGTLLLARIIQAYGLGQAKLKLRITGMVMTAIVLLGSALTLMVKFFLN